MNVHAVTSPLGVFGLLTVCLGSEVLDQRSHSLSQTLCHLILRTCGGRNAPCLSYAVLSLVFVAARFKFPNPVVLAWTISMPTNETITSGSFQLDSSSEMLSAGHLCWHLRSPITSTFFLWEPGKSWAPPFSFPEEMPPVWPPVPSEQSAKSAANSEHFWCLQWMLNLSAVITS